MSGGSFDYLCFKAVPDIFDAERSLASMGDALAVLGYAPDAARETHAVLAEVRAARARIEAKLERLEGVWRAVEWWHSNDSTEDGVRRALADYRGASPVGGVAGDSSIEDPGSEAI